MAATQETQETQENALKPITFNCAFCRNPNTFHNIKDFKIMPNETECHICAEENVKIYSFPQCPKHGCCITCIGIMWRLAEQNTPDTDPAWDSNWYRGDGWFNTSHGEVLIPAARYFEYNEDVMDRMAAEAEMWGAMLANPIIIRKQH